MIRIQNAKIFKSMLAKLLVAVMIVSSVITMSPSMSATAAAKPAISKKESNILVAKKYNLNINNKIKGSTYQWKSSNTKIATVTSRGIVKGIKTGKVTITCTVKTSKATYKLTSKVLIRIPATSFVINNKISALNLLQKYNLNKTIAPKTSNDKTYWTTSDSHIAAPNANGIFTAKKVGTVTITGKTLSGKKDSVTIKVVDQAGTVTTQKELEDLLGSGVALITIKTDAEATFTIPEGDYSNQKLVVDAPKADVTNKGVFKTIEIKQIKSTTWHEQAIGNVLIITAPNASVIIDKDASASISVENNDTKLTLVNNGTVSELVMNADADVTISGTTTTSIPITANVSNATITTSIPLTVTCNKKINLVILAGAEATIVTVASKELIPTITGTGTITVKVGTGENVEIVKVEATPVEIVIPPVVFPSDPTPPTTPTTTKTVNRNTDGTYTLPANFSDITNVVVNYGEFHYQVNNTLLSALRGFILADSVTIGIWESIVDTTQTIGTNPKQGVHVEAISGDSAKKVTFTGGQLADRIYKVKVNNTGSVTITRMILGLPVLPCTISKSADNITLTISEVPVNLSFEVTYK